MRRYFESAAVGLGIGSFILAFYLAVYWHPGVVIVTLIQSALQGLASAVIYSRLKIPYLYKYILHAIVSYLLAFATFLAVELSTGSLNFWNFVNFTISWIVIFAVIFVYFYFRNNEEAREINKKLNRKEAERSRERASKEKK